MILYQGLPIITHYYREFVNVCQRTASAAIGDEEAALVAVVPGGAAALPEPAAELADTSLPPRQADGPDEGGRYLPQGGWQPPPWGSRTPPTPKGGTRISTKGTWC